MHDLKKGRYLQEKIGLRVIYTLGKGMSNNIGAGLSLPSVARWEEEQEEEKGEKEMEEESNLIVGRPACHVPTLLYTIL